MVKKKIYFCAKVNFQKDDTKKESSKKAFKVKRKERKKIQVIADYLK